MLPCVMPNVCQGQTKDRSSSNLGGWLHASEGANANAIECAFAGSDDGGSLTISVQDTVSAVAAKAMAKAKASIPPPSAKLYL